MRTFIFTVAFCFSINLNSQVSFLTTTSYSLPQTPYSVVSADFNNDGKLDLATVSYLGNSISSLLGNGTGTFASPTNFPTSFAGYSIVCADFNTDGKMDAAVANDQSASSISVFFGDGLGGFGSPTNFPTPYNPQWMVTADFNGDGKMDLATANYSSNNVAVLLGNGFGSFSAYTAFPVDIGCYTIIASDFNSDGKMDIATANANAGTVSILLGNGIGGFSGVSNFAAGMMSISLVSGDFNSDGKLDIATSNYASGDVSILLGNGLGNFSPPTNYAIAPGLHSITAADINCDNKIDLIAANIQTNSVSVLEGNGQGVFLLTANFAVGTNPDCVISRDINLDGKMDLVITNTNSNNLSILINNGIYGNWTPLTVNNAITYNVEQTIPWSCNTIFDFNTAYNYCLSCTPNSPIYRWNVSLNGLSIASGTSLGGGNSKFTPTTSGTYTLNLNAACNGISTPNCVYNIIVSDCTSDPDCCTGGKWISKSIDWSSINHVGTISTNLKDKIVNNISTPKEKNGASIQLPTSLPITNCDAIYHLSQNSTYTFNATYQCGVSTGQNCSSIVKVKIEGINNNALDGIYNAPFTQIFATADSYKITYYAYCGNKVCESCTFILAIDRNCCLGSKWISKTYTKTAVNNAVSSPATLLGLLDNPVGLKPVIYAGKAVNVNLKYACGSCCANATYRLIQKDISVTPNTTIVNTIINGSASIYTYSKTTRVWITPLCDGKPCGDAVIFDIGCNNKFGCAKLGPSVPTN